MKWIKIVTDIFDDEKILLIEAMPDADSIIVIWFKLLCLAGKLNSCGVLIMNSRIVYTDEMLSQVFRRPINTIRLALKTFEQFGMIEIVNDAITIPNWEKHQNIEGMERVREQNRNRQRQWYNRQKTLTNVTPNVRLTQPNATDIDKEKEGDIDIYPPPQTPQEVADYCRAERIGLTEEEAKRFFTIMEGQRWKHRNGKPIRDWRMLVATWAKSGGNAGKQVTAQQYGQRDYTEEELLAVSDDLIAEARRNREENG